MVGDDDIPAAGMHLSKFLLAVSPHMHHYVAARFDEPVCLPDDRIGIVVRTGVVPCIDDLAPAVFEVAYALPQTVYHGDVRTVPSHRLFGPLKMDDVIRFILFPEIPVGTMHVDALLADGFAEYRDEEIVCVVFSEYN